MSNDTGAEITDGLSTLQMPNSAYQKYVSGVDQEMYEEGVRTLNQPESIYRARMMLDAELKDLPAGSAVWDIGCGTGRTIMELQRNPLFSHLRFYGVNPGRIQIRDTDHELKEFCDTNVLEGLAEELDTSVLAQAQKKGIGRPQVILMSNVLKFSSGRKTFGETMRAAYNTLMPQGKLLIYEDLGAGMYPLYIDLISKMPSVRFDIDENPGNGQYKFYLCLTKTS